MNEPQPDAVLNWVLYCDSGLAEADSVTNEPPPDPAQQHISVVYFHGMGSQRRQEEVCQLIDSLDRFAHHREAESALGILVGIEPRVELPRGGLTADVAYVRASLRPPNKEGAWGRIHFYEAYWAPNTAGGVPPLQVVRWLVSQIPNPLWSLLTVWRLRARLRRVSLRHLWSRLQRQTPPKFQEKDLRQLLEAYDLFEGPEARRNYPRGTFAEFARFLQSRAKPDEQGRVEELARLWLGWYTRREFLSAFILITFGLAVLLTVGALALGIFQILTLLGGSGVTLDVLRPTSQNVLIFLGGLLTLAGIYGFLQNYLGDVLLWTTYRETDEHFKTREQILKTGAAILRHVLLDKTCNRVVVVAHSLGTCVALDSLLELGRYNWGRTTDVLMGDDSDAALPLAKLDQFITMGSPIDKVHYFFESNRGGTHRYNRVSERIRGDIASVPFAKNRKPHIHWINLWDQADIISGPLESPTHASNANLAIDNHEVDSYLFPLPRTSHNAYFENERAIEIIFRSICLRDYTFQGLPLKPGGKGYDYQSQLLGPGQGRWTTWPLQMLVLALPWLICVLSILVWTKAIGFVYALVAVAVPLAVLALAWLESRIRGLRKPLR